MSTYPKLIEYLIAQGNWTDADIVKLIGGNILRVLEKNEEVRNRFLLREYFINRIFFIVDSKRTSKDS